MFEAMYQLGLNVWWLLRALYTFAVEITLCVLYMIVIFAFFMLLFNVALGVNPL